MLGQMIILTAAAFEREVSVVHSPAVSLASSFTTPLPSLPLLLIFQSLPQLKPRSPIPLCPTSSFAPPVRCPPSTMADCYRPGAGQQQTRRFSQPNAVGRDNTSLPGRPPGPQRYVSSGHVETLRVISHAIVTSVLLHGVNGIRSFLRSDQNHGHRSSR